MDVIIRKANLNDPDRVVVMIKQFEKEILEDYDVNLNTPNFKEEMLSYVDTSFVAEKDGELIGLLAGRFIKFPFTTNKIYQESIWFMRREYRKSGLLLMNFLEKWCKEQKVKFIVTSRMANYKSEKFDRVYKHLGFIPYEVNYIKNLEKEESRE